MSEKNGRDIYNALMCMLVVQSIALGVGIGYILVRALS